MKHLNINQPFKRHTCKIKYGLQMTLATFQDAEWTVTYNYYQKKKSMLGDSSDLKLDLCFHNEAEATAESNIEVM